MQKCKKQKKGFALLYAILLTSAVLIVGVSLINIITRQLVLTSLNRNSQIAYYNSRSMTECLDFYVKKNDYFLAVDLETGIPTGVKNSQEIECGFLSSPTITVDSEEIEDTDIYVFQGQANFSENGSSNFSVYYNWNNLKDGNSYDGCGDEIITNSFQASCAKVIRTSGSNFSLSNSNPRKVERISLVAR